MVGIPPFNYELLCNKVSGEKTPAPPGQVSASLVQFCTIRSAVRGESAQAKANPCAVRVPSEGAVPRQV
jgi:hypothetical protein